MSHDSSYSDATIDRPVRLRVRPDLQIRPLGSEPQPYRVIRDPVSLHYHQLREPEFALFQMLDGQISLRRMKEAFERQFAPRKLDIRRLQFFLGQLHRDSLVYADTTGQAVPLLERGARRRLSATLQGLFNVLAIRVPGFNPMPLLNAVYPKCRWIFSPLMLLFGGALMVLALVLVATRLSAPDRLDQEFAALLMPTNWIWLLLTLSATKILHEVGHALACRHFGANCREMGLMLLVFTPCLYCDVSDSWMLPSKWSRMAITAAGMLVELLLASAAAVLWYFSQPGLLHTLSLNVVLVCSVGTLLLNGNPLLRYDGYFLLSDWLDVPNLWEESRALLRRALLRYGLGMELRGDSLYQGQGAWLATYAAASVAYRLVVLVGILMFLHRILEPHGLGAIWDGLVLATFAGFLVDTSRSGQQLFQRSKNLRKGAATRSLAVILFFLAALFLLPLPHRAIVPAVVQCQDAAHIYVTVPGRLQDAVQSGTAVAAGDIVAKLENSDLQRQILALEAEERSQQVRMRSLEAIRGDDPQAAAQIPTLVKALAGTREQLRQLHRDLESLILKAPRSGIALAPPMIHPLRTAPEQLPELTGSPLDAANRGAFLHTGALLCTVGDPRQLELLVTVDQEQVEFVRVGQVVRARLAQHPGQTLQGEITEIAKMEMRSDDPETDDSRRREIDKVATIPTTYQARVRLQPFAIPISVGARGRAAIQLDAEPLFPRLWRYLRRTFAL